jgi:hypothetical protein
MTEHEKQMNAIDNARKEMVFIAHEPDPNPDENEICGECGEQPPDHDHQCSSYEPEIHPMDEEHCELARIMNGESHA